MADSGGSSDLFVAPDDVAALGKYAYDLAAALRTARADAGRQVRAVTEKGWTGTASASFTAGWTECQDGGEKIVEALATMASTLGVTAQTYARHDNQVAARVSSLNLP